LGNDKVFIRGLPILRRRFSRTVTPESNGIFGHDFCFSLVAREQWLKPA
jgi:hypothetical protein